MAYTRYSYAVARKNCLHDCDHAYFRDNLLSQG